MLTYTGSRNLFGTLSGDKSSANLTVGDTLINTYAKKIAKKFKFLEDTFSITTVASQQFYKLPIDFGMFKTIYLTNGTTRYFPKLVTSQEQWDKINATTSTTSDVPEYCFIQAGQIGFYPTPSTEDLVFTLNYHIKYRDLSVADYTTGTITSIANGGTALVGFGTTWTAGMVGRYIQIPEAQGGDGYWYKIAAFVSTTALTLDKPYEGTSIAAATATYTIGQCFPIPEEYQMLPVFESLETFFTSIKPDATKMALYKAKVKELKQDLMADHGSTSTSPVCTEEIADIENVNNYIFSTT